MELPPADKTSLFDKTKPIVSEEEWRDLGLLIIFLTRIEVNDCQQRLSGFMPTTPNPITPNTHYTEIKFPYIPNAHYTEFGIMNTKDGHYTEKEILFTPNAH